VRPCDGGRAHGLRPCRARRTRGRGRFARPAVPLRHPGPAAPGRAPGPGRVRAVVGGGRRPQRGGPRGARRPPQAATGQHAQDPVRPDRPAGAARRPPAHGRCGGPRGHRPRQQPRRGRPGADLPGGRPVARGLPQLRERRRARAGPAQRRLAYDGHPDAGQGARPGRPRHPRPLPRRLRRPGAGLLRVRPRGLRPGGAAQRGLRAVLRHGRGEVPRPGRMVVRDPEHQPAADRRRRGGALRRADRDQERLHESGRQHARRRRPPGRPDAGRNGDEPTVGRWLRGLRGGAPAARLGVRLGRAGGSGGLAGRAAGETETAAGARGRTGRGGGRTGR